MKEQFVRTAALLGEEAVEKLSRAHVAVFGLGGVGSYIVEALARSGVGHLTLVDNDLVSESNINRQLIADHGTVGIKKTEAERARVLAVNPECEVILRETFVLPDTIGEFDFRDCDYVADAIDTVSGKLAILENARKASVPVISAMGAGNKLDPTKFTVAPIEKTSVCPLAKVMRKECKDRGITGVKAVYSTEEIPGDKRFRVPASVAFVPSVMGLIMAGEIIKDIAGASESDS